MRGPYRILICCVCLALALAACGDSIFGESTPLPGPRQPTRYSSVIENAPPPVSPPSLRDGIRPDAVVFEYPLFDYQDALERLPDARLRDAQVIGYDDVNRLMYYYFSLVEKDRAHIFVGSINVINGSREQIASFTNVYHDESGAVGDESESGEELLTLSDDIPLFIINTPGFHLFVESSPSFFAALMDTGDLFIFNGDEFLVYRRGNSAYEIIYRGDLGAAVWEDPGYIQMREELLGEGWTIDIVDIAPVIVSPDEDFISPVNAMASTEIFFLYLFTPPFVDDIADPHTPDFSDDAHNREFGDVDGSGGTLQDMFGDNRPFLVPVLYKRQVRAEIDAQSVLDEDSLTFRQSMTINTTPVLKDWSSYLVPPDYRGTSLDKITEASFIPVGTRDNNGFLLISTQSAITLYAGRSELAFQMPSLMSAYEMNRRELNAESGNMFNPNHDIGETFREHSFHFHNMAEYIGSVNGFRNMYMRSDMSSVSRLALGGLDRRMIDENYAQRMRARNSFYTLDELLLFDNPDDLAGFRRMMELTVHDAISDLIVLARETEAWDSHNSYVTQRTLPAHSDSNFLAEGFTVFPAVAAARSQTGHPAASLPMDDDIMLPDDYHESGWLRLQDGGLELTMPQGNLQGLDSMFRPSFSGVNFTSPDPILSYHVIADDTLFRPGSVNFSVEDAHLKFFAPRNPIWELLGDSFGLPDFDLFKMPPLRLEDGFEEVASNGIRQDSNIALSANLYDGLTVYYTLRSQQIPVRHVWRSGILRDEYSFEPAAWNFRGNFWILGHHLPGAYFHVFGTNLEMGHCILVGSWEENRGVLLPNMHEASVMVVRIDDSMQIPIEEQDWITFP